MYKVAEASSHATFPAVESTARLPKVRYGGKFAVDGSARVPAGIQRVAGLLSRVLVLEPRVDVADQVVIVIVAHDQLLDLAVLAHLAPDVLVKGVEVVLELRSVHSVLGIEGRVLIKVGHQNRLGVGGFHVLPRTAVAVAARANLVVEGAVDFVLLGSENGGQEVCHFD